jgi:hypothetical protein
VIGLLVLEPDLSGPVHLRNTIAGLRDLPLEDVNRSGPVLVTVEVEKASGCRGAMGIAGGCGA